MQPVQKTTLQEPQMQISEQNSSKEDLSRVVFKLAKFLFNKNLLDEFKKEHSREKQLMTDIEGQIEKPIPPKKKPKKKKKQQRPVEKQEPLEQEEQGDLRLTPQIQQPPASPDNRWEVWVKDIEQFMKNEYYIYDSIYYKLKSASYTMFQFHFKLDVVNTRNNRREELILNKNKRIYWVNTMKIELICEGTRYLVQLPSSEKVFIENPVYLQAIKKYWNKATFYAVVPTTLGGEPCAEIIMIQFNY